MNHKQTILMEERLSGKNIAESAILAGLSQSYARRLFAGLDTKGNFKKELDRRKGEIQKKLRLKTDITKASLIVDFIDIRDKALAAGKFSAACKALESISRMIGAYSEDNKQKGLGSLGEALAGMVRTRDALLVADERERVKALPAVVITDKGEEHAE